MTSRPLRSSLLTRTLYGSLLACSPLLGPGCDDEPSRAPYGTDDGLAAPLEPEATTARPRVEVVYRVAPDDSVLDDLAYLSHDAPLVEIDAPSLTARLQPTTSEAAVGPDSLTAVNSHPILIEYVGKGHGVEAGVPEPPDVPADPEVLRREDASPYLSLAGANMVSGNRFRMHLPKNYLEEFGELTPWVDPNAEDAPQALANRAALAGPGDGEIADAFTVPLDPQAALSNNYDSRQQIYGTNGSVGGVNRWLVRVGTGCTAALVGARHVVTAAHCVTDYGSNGNSWKLDNVTFRVGRNGSSNNGSITIDTNDIPPGEVAWWWTSTGWTDGTAGSVADFAIVTLPGSFGCQSYSGQCNFAYSFTHKSNLTGYTIYERGYPVCDPAMHNGGHRIDEPCQNNGQTPANCANYAGALCDTPCRDHHVYGQSLGCGWGDFSDSGQRFWHGCDASAGDSGAPVYYNKNGTWTLAGVHYGSACGKSCSDSCAGQSRPSRATRMTKGRRNTINWFIDNWPNY